MATIYIVRPSIELFAIDDSVLAPYLAAGWTQATAGQFAVWAASDPYNGLQGAPPAPPLISPNVAPPVTELSN